MGNVLTSLINVTEVGRTRIAVVTLFVLLAACVIYQQLTLSSSGTFPHVARGRSIWIDTTLHF